MALAYMSNECCAGAILLKNIGPGTPVHQTYLFMSLYVRFLLPDECQRLATNTSVSV